MAKKKKEAPVSVDKKQPVATQAATKSANTGRNTEQQKVDARPVEPAMPPFDWRKLNIYDFRWQAIIVAALAFVFYINSSMNEFAHDDGIVIVKNEYVQEGFAGIEKILTRDAYDSYYRQLNTGNQLSGGRYRPLSIVTFAIEQQFFGAVPVEKIDSFMHRNIAYGATNSEERKLVQEMQIRHFFNVVWYMLLAVTVLYFLRYIIFPGDPLVALLAAVLFTIHPIHTEVVANVKSRDEIMSLFFMCMTFILAYKFEEKRKLWLLGLAMLSYFLAFMSKEYAITLAFLLPFSFFVFKNYSVKKSIIAFLPYAVIIFIYLIIRIKIAIITSVGEEAGAMTYDEILDAIRHTSGNSEKEILNNPYYYATHPQKIATEIATSLNYLKLLMFPYPLSADYSYNTIPYKDFGNIWVYISAIVHLTLIGIAIFFGFIKKNYKVLGFAIFFYIIHLLLVNNLIFDIGATMGERLIFHSSLGFAIVAAWLLFKGFEKIKPLELGHKALLGFIGVITVIFGIITIERNTDWKNDASLFAADLKVAPNSILVNANVAASYISRSDYEKDSVKKHQLLVDAIAMLDKTINLHQHTFVAGFLNRGIAWYKLGDIDKAKANMDTVKNLYPNYPTLKGMYALLSDHYMKKGWDSFGRVGRYAEAIVEFKKGLAFDSTNPQLWYNLGGAYYSNHQLQEAIQAWQVSLKLNPANVQAQQGLQAAMGMLAAETNEKQKGGKKK